jgi:hypothetical protein
VCVFTGGACVCTQETTEERVMRVCVFLGGRGVRVYTGDLRSEFVSVIEPYSSLKRALIDIYAASS